MKKALIFALLLLFATFLPSGIPIAKLYLEERLPDEFSVEKVAMDIKGDFPVYPLPNLTEIAEQPFHYIGHGAQAVAFASEDGKWVLKFFLERSMHGKKRFPIPKPTHWIPSHRKKRHERRNRIYQENLFKTMRNYVGAFERFKEKTGLVAMHLAATDDPLPLVHLFDNRQQEHWIDLKRASFVMQKKAVPVKEKLAQLPDMEKGQALRALEEFFAMRAKEGFLDVERNFMIEANYGFIGNTPIQLDAGSIEYMEELKAAPEQEIARMHSLLRNWASGQGY